ncbi:MAG: amidohydrolase [Gemmatimonadales bacterium]
MPQRSVLAHARTPLGLVGLLALGCAGGSRQAPADLVLVNGVVLTVDSSDVIAEAVAIRGNRIAAVGSTASIDSLVGPETERIDLAGRTVTPGLLDAHNHFSSAAADRTGMIDLSYPHVASIEEIARAVAARADEAPGDGWVLGRGWDEGKLTERRLITARDLDRVVPDRPVWLEQTMGHYGVANSAALALARIDRDTRDPPGGTIDRGPDGVPTGVLKESAQRLVTSLIPAPTRADVEASMEALARELNAEGMTGLKDPVVTDSAWASYQRLLAAGALPLRVFALWAGGLTTEGAQELIARRGAETRPDLSAGDDHLIAGGVKIFADGSGGARTAWVSDDWNRDRTGRDAGNRGYPTTDPDTLRAVIRMYHDAGLHVSTHAIGDRAIDLVVDTYTRAMAENPKPGLRHGIIHANIPSDHAIEAMAGLQRDFDAGYPEPSATFMWWIGDTYAGNFGPRTRRLDPFATFLRRGVRWANGSDFPVTPFPARYGIWASVARATALGTYRDDPYGRNEAVDARTALRAATIWVAHQMFLDEKIGSIEPGKYADLAVWDRNPHAVPTAQLEGMRCLLTIFDGRVVYRAEDR